MEVFRSRAEALAALDRAMRWQEESRGGLDASNPVTPALARGLIEAVPDEVAVALVVSETYQGGRGPAALRATAVNLTGPAGAFALRTVVADSCRLVLRSAWNETDQSLRKVAANLRALRSGDPARDAELFACGRRA